VAKTVASDKETTIRFQGRHYYDDEKHEEDQKEGIKYILSLCREIEDLELRCCGVLDVIFPPIQTFQLG
jgi:hypothetical protein